MVLAADVITSEDMSIAKRQEATLSARRHLQNFSDKSPIGKMVSVLQAVA